MKHRSILSKLKSQVKLIESLITEGDHWPEDYRRKAVNRIKLATSGKTPVYNENDIVSDVDTLVSKFEPLSHKNSNVGYFLPIIRMFINYVGNDQAKRKEFVDNKMDMLVKTLGIISHDPSLEAKFKDDIKQKWSLEDFEKHAAELQTEIDKADADTLASVNNSESVDYDVILIESYKELNAKFGGNKTGYKGQSEWCHTNGRSTYNSWTGNGTKQFFVLAKKGWENITPPDPKTTNAFDEYGTSLIAILVKVENSELLNATLRWNHVIDPSKTVPKTSADKAFLGWGDLSKAVGFNVKAVVEKEIKERLNELKQKIEKINKEISDKLKTVNKIIKSTLTKVEKRFITHLDIPDNVTSIGRGAFSNWDGLTSVTIGNGVTSIGDSAFKRCDRLTSVTIGDSVKSIDWGAFAYCYNLASITIPDSVTSIEASVFWDCGNLTSVTIGKGVTSIGAGAFSQCGSLTKFVVDSNNPNYKSINGLLLSKDGKNIIAGVNGDVVIPQGVTSIGDGAFHGCFGLTNVTIPDSVTSIGDQAFLYCPELKNITIPRSVTSVRFRAFASCVGLTSVTFEGKTIDEVRSMRDYPWDINNPEEVIRVADASN